VAYVGSVKAHKGALLFEELVGRFPKLTWSVLGGGDPEILARLRRLPRVTVRGYYRAGSLPGLLRRRRVGLALMLSIVPESYGLTLDESLSAGVPVIAFDHGAVAARVRELGGGVLVSPEEGIDGVERCLRGILGDPRRAAVPPGITARLPDVHAAARSWRDLYRRLEGEESGP
jgi:glycosyltransferase involved in cell wall biosynthesis